MTCDKKETSWKFVCHLYIAPNLNRCLFEKHRRVPCHQLFFVAKRQWRALRPFVCSKDGVGYSLHEHKINHKIYKEYIDIIRLYWSNKNIKLVDLFANAKCTAFNKHQDCNAHVDKISVDYTLTQHNWDIKGKCMTIIVFWNIMRRFIEKRERNCEKTRQTISIIATCFLHIIAQCFACNQKICLTNWKSKMPILIHSSFVYSQYHICLYWRFLFK